ncbi:hypothetical protein ACTMTF_04210 [Nonomuraea sp. ZG12]|uniref:hypothetical protein n=1 Tax=Nonomuraea sp. ZG12 TaxID=3452207 RepID=UPI003F8A46C6
MRTTSRHLLLPARKEFGNGRQFYERAGERIALPQQSRDRPHRDALEWHLDEIFLR